MTFLMAAVAFAAVVSCQKDDPKEDPVTDVTATVTGTVIDDQDKPISDVTVTFVTSDSKKETKATATTDASGKFSATVPSTGRVVNFTKSGYASASTSIAESKFSAGATIDLGTIVMEFSEAQIEGKVLNLAGEPYSGVTAKLNDKTTTTDADGIYKFDGLTIKDYKIQFSDAEGNTAEVSVAASDFTDGIAYVANITLGSYIIPGLTYNDFVNAAYWYGNDYAGGYGAFCAQWNNVGFLTAYPMGGVGNIRNAAEGISLYCSADAEGELASYMYGRKQIAEGNCYVNLCARNFRASADNPAKLDIAVLDLSANTREVTYLPAQDIYQGLKKMNGGTSMLDVEHNLFVFDLSAYKGKEIAFAIGVLGGYSTDGDQPETPIVRIMFADKDLTAEFEAENLTACFSGDKPAGCEEWASFTKANISSVAPASATSFSGLAGEAHNDGANVGCDYNPWRGTNHIAVNWALQIRNEAYTPIQDGIFALNGVYGKNYNSPSSYIFNRFSSPKKTMTVKTRSYVAGEPTLFRATVVDLSNYAATALVPSNSASGVSVVEDGNGCLAIDHDFGSKDSPDELAAITFDLSAYAGKDIVIVLANHGGNPLPIYSIDFAD